jgi:hypothetical protein
MVDDLARIAVTDERLARLYASGVSSWRRNLFVRSWPTVSSRIHIKSARRLERRGRPGCRRDRSRCCALARGFLASAPPVSASCKAFPRAESRDRLASVGDRFPYHRGQGAARRRPPQRSFLDYAAWPADMSLSATGRHRHRPEGA